ncbi:CRE-TRK-1 protein [Caenorhabditis remanei]|uniref:CRE-TRK-1 protein n=1 Tax=Caenorhabditis remanei TaxID=31234 RepID=E3NAR2_CAERE|nr:CRE-TRK-1 protein [Caenorhabditis remanei]
MILRIVLILPILVAAEPILSGFTIDAECVKVSKDTERCDYLFAFNGTAKAIIVSGCDDLRDDFIDYGPWPTVTNVTFNCAFNDFPWNFTDVFPNIRYVHFNKCNLRTLQWQSVYTDTLRIVDLTECPIECNCQNQWMKADGSFGKLKEPLSLKRCVPDCDSAYMKINQTMITGNGGENVTIHVDIRDSFINRTIDKPYFEWAFAKSRHNYEELVSQSTADLVITNLTREDMGLIGVICWHCVDFLTTKVELRVNLPIKVEFVEKTRGDTDFLVVQGYPIENITLSITRVQSNHTESNVMDNEYDSVFFSSLIVRPEKRTNSIFYQRTYRIFTKDIADGDHLSGDLRFEVCTMGNCGAVEKHVSHLGVINGTLEDFVRLEYPYKQGVHVTISLLLFCLLMILIAFGLYFKEKVRDLFREKVTGLRKRATLASEMVRRASHDTEQTLLRLEERHSLASDYSNMTLPFIDMGNIQIHEMLGKGHFGEVYLGSWEQTGPNSVAIKSIRHVDMETEKEAQVLRDLDHPNIVKLYGMTRNNFNLLLVFEHMNFGDLKTYLEKRSPIKSLYLQYPPPLVNDELKWIIKEITVGVCYLVTQSVVHRDLAARNCLVAGDSDMRAPSHLQRPPLRIKISDFGMSRRLYDHSDYYTMDHQGALPVRWLPPEAVQSHRFTFMSDIWALGVTMWECMAYGKQPFDGLSNLEVSSFTLAGMRPLKPERCPQEMYDLMVKCWHMEPSKRITAVEILEDHVFDKIRGGLPYEPIIEKSIVASCRTNINRYQDEIAETSFTHSPGTSENTGSDGGSECYSETSGVTFQTGYSTEPLLDNKKEDDISLFATA